MKTRLILALYFLRRATDGVFPWLQGEDRETQQNRVIQNFILETPYLVLPNCIRLFNNADSAHFQKGEICSSWVEFPAPEYIEELTKENLQNLSCYQGAQKSAYGIGNDIDLEAFSLHNLQHPYYMQLKAVLTIAKQFWELIGAEIVEEAFPLLDYEAKNVFCKNGRNLTKAQAEEQLNEFQDLLFIKVVETVYKRTGILMADWFWNSCVYAGIKLSYSEEISEELWSDIALTEKLSRRIDAKEFEITEADKENVSMVDNLEAMIIKFIADVEAAI